MKDTKQEVKIEFQVKKPAQLHCQVILIGIKLGSTFFSFTNNTKPYLSCLYPLLHSLDHSVLTFSFFCFSLLWKNDSLFQRSINGNNCLDHYGVYYQSFKHSGSHHSLEFDGNYRNYSSNFSLQLTWSLLWKSSFNPFSNWNLAALMKIFTIGIFGQ